MVVHAAVAVATDAVADRIRPIPAEFEELIRSYNAPVMDGLTDELRSGDPSVAIRFNRRKSSGLQPVSADQVPWCADGFYLDRREAFTFDPAFHQGLYYVQDPSSMIIAEAVRRLTAGTPRPLLYLDACAAPGGKTTAAIDALPQGSMVVANEFVPARAAVLRDNVVKWGYPAAVVTQGDTARFRKLRDMFHIIAADVPCSGEGMMRKDDDAVAQWSPALVERCAALQREIVANLWEALAPGGYLIYSTCTFNRSEDEENLRWMVDELGAEPVDLDLPGEWMIAGGIDTELPCYRFLPHRLRGEGLFMGVVCKPGEWQPKRAKSDAKASRKDKGLESVEKWLRLDAEVALVAETDRVSALPRRWLPEITTLRKALNVIYCGVEVATVKGRDMIPAHALAMSDLLSNDAFASVEVDYPTAIAYLRREAVALPADADVAKGYVLLTFRNRPLGWVKHLGNRSNNLYPAPMRILSTHIPDNLPAILR